MKVVNDLIERAFCHDATKLESPEKEYYDLHTQGLHSLEYGSKSYKEVLRKMQPGIDHHYAHNRHHPQFFADGINGMNLVDLIELLCDWKAAGERHVDKPVDIFRSIDINADEDHFNIEPQMVQILKNTASYLWFE
jgi:hypothetical protein